MSGHHEYVNFDRWPISRFPYIWRAVLSLSLPLSSRRVERSKSFLRGTKHVCPALGNPDHPSENRMFHLYYHPLRFPSIIKVSRLIARQGELDTDLLLFPYTVWNCTDKPAVVGGNTMTKREGGQERRRIKWQRSEVRSVCVSFRKEYEETRKRERKREREREKWKTSGRENASKTKRKARWNPLGGVSLSVFECYLYPSSSSSRFASIWCSLFSSFSAILLDSDGLKSALSYFMSRYIRG